MPDKNERAPRTRGSDEHDEQPEGLDGQVIVIKDAALLRAFRLARERLRELVKVRPIEAVEKSIGSRATLRRLLLAENAYASDAFGTAMMRKVIDFADAPVANASLYAMLAQTMRQSMHDHASIATDYVGDYIYFRHTAHEAEGKPEPQYVRGRISIALNDNREPVFRHWSSDKERDNPDGEPEHSGYVFRAESQLFLLGWRYGVMRLAIARTRDRERSEGFLPGVLTSVRTGPRDPFAARFLMVPVENSDLIAQLEPDGTSEPQERFFTLTKGSYSHYMLVH